MVIPVLMLVLDLVYAITSTTINTNINTSASTNTSTSADTSTGTGTSNHRSPLRSLSTIRRQRCSGSARNQLWTNIWGNLVVKGSEPTTFWYFSSHTDFLAPDWASASFREFPEWELAFREFPKVSDTLTESCVFLSVLTSFREFPRVEFPRVPADLLFCRLLIPHRHTWFRMTIS